MDKIQTTHSHQLNNHNQNDMLDLTAASKNEKLQDDYEKCSCNDLPSELLINIFKYLPHSDLQQIRLVCKRWDNISRSPELVRKSKIVIGPASTGLVDQFFLKNEDGESARIFAYDTMDLRGQDLSCEELQLFLNSWRSNAYKLRLYKTTEYDATPASMPKLREMVLFHVPSVQNGDPCSVNPSKFNGFKLLEISCSILGSHQNFTRHEDFKMEKLSFELEYSHEEWFIDTLQYHSKSLKHLEIIGHKNPVFGMKWKQVFASLRQLEDLQISNIPCCGWLQQIIQYLPKETPLRHCHLRGVPHLDDLLLKQIIHKWPKTLASMELMFCSALTDDAIKDLGLLRHNLTSLNMLHCRKVSVRGLLQGLVAEENNCLTTLILNGMPGIDQESMGLLMTRLPQLTYLSLENCRDCVTDSTLQYIFHYQRKLQHLILDNCTQITDKGILGFGANPAPIRNLKGLQSLSLMSCSNLSNRTLAEGLKFNEIRKLVLGYLRKITSMGIQELVRNCPSLDDLTVCSCSMIDDDAVLHIVAGLPRIRYLNVSNCFQLTSKSIHCVVEQCMTMKEFNICGLNLDEAGKSIF